MIPIECQNCDKKYEVQDELSGNTVTCPACSATVMVPMTAKKSSSWFGQAKDKSQELLDQHFAKAFQALLEYERRAPGIEIPT